MAFTLDRIIPWGRSFAEYVRMFALSEDELASKRIVGCADGPASFNAEATRRGGRVVSCDPLYAFTRAEIGRRIDETFSIVLEQTRANAGAYLWSRGIDSPDALGTIRMKAMEAFLEDFEQGLREGRYRAMSLPRLAFEDGAFDLAICSHFLFLYSDHLDAQFHIDAALEMLRLAPEARIFPLLTLDGRPSPHVNLVVDSVIEKGFEATVVPVPYEFQKGGNQMLLLRRPRLSSSL